MVWASLVVSPRPSRSNADRCTPTRNDSTLTHRPPERSIGHLTPTQPFVAKVGNTFAALVSALQSIALQRYAPLTHRQPVTIKPASHLGQPFVVKTGTPSPQFPAPWRCASRSDAMFRTAVACQFHDQELVPITGSPSR